MIVKYTEKAKKQLSKLDKPDSKAIDSYMGAIEKLENPRSRGKGLVGTLAGVWRYRIGDYRVLCLIQDEVMTILVVEIDHRKQVYR